MVSDFLSTLNRCIMSAFLCSDYHIATMAGYIAKTIKAESNIDIDLQMLANKIKHVNIASVDYRYNENTRKTKCNLKARDINANDFAALYACWDYQACEGNQLDYVIMSGFLKGFADKGNRTFSEINWSI